jgi:hypothetical protein
LIIYGKTEAKLVDSTEMQMPSWWIVPRINIAKLVLSGLKCSCQAGICDIQLIMICEYGLFMYYMSAYFLIKNCLIAFMA